jgi:hypothetical protein
MIVLLVSIIVFMHNWLLALCSSDIDSCWLFWCAGMHVMAPCLACQCWGPCKLEFVMMSNLAVLQPQLGGDIYALTNISFFLNKVLYERQREVQM